MDGSKHQNGLNKGCGSTDNTCKAIYYNYDSVSIIFLCVCFVVSTETISNVWIVIIIMYLSKKMST